MLILLFTYLSQDTLVNKAAISESARQDALALSGTTRVLLHTCRLHDPVRSRESDESLAQAPRVRHSCHSDRMWLLLAETGYRFCRIKGGEPSPLPASGSNGLDALGKPTVLLGSFCAKTPRLFLSMSSPKFFNKGSALQVR